MSKKPHKSQNHTFTSGFNTHAQTYTHTPIGMQCHYCCSLNPSLASLCSPLLPTPHLLSSTSFIFPSSPPTLLFSLPLLFLTFPFFYIYILVLLSASFPPLLLLCFLFIHVKQACCNNGMFYSCWLCVCVHVCVRACGSNLH